MFVSKNTLFPSIFFLVFNASAMAEDKGKEIPPVTASFEARTEMLSDSSVGISEIDQNTDQSDSAWQVTLSPSVVFKPNDTFSVNASYDWSRKEYIEQEEFNLDLGSLHVDASAKVAGYSLGARYDRSEAKLDGKDFLILAQRSAYVARLIDQRWYWRVSGIAKDKSFSGREDRNAENTGGRIDVFAFLSNMQVIWAAGFASDVENANDPLFDYAGLAANLSLTRKFELFGAKSEVKFAYRYSVNEYSEYDESIGDKRLDQGAQASVGFKLQALKNMALIAEAVKRDYSSNLSSAEYDEVVLSAGLEFEF